MQIPNWVKYLFLFILFVVATVGIVWLAGFFFILFCKANPFGAKKVNFSTWWTYWHYYKGVHVIAKRLIVSGIVSVVICYGTLIALIINALRDDRPLHGDARFAKTDEIEKAGLFSPKGIIVGKHKDRYLLFPGMQFVLLAAPTRSGKGVGIVVPNLLNFDESMVVLDVKLENFLITSRYRQSHGQEIYLFNPFSEDGKSHRYNPLGYISDNPRLRVADILSIGQALYPGAGKEIFFDEAARNLFLGLALYLCETPTLPRTMGELLRQSTGKGQPVKTYISELIKSRNYRDVEEVDDEGNIVVKSEPITQWDGKGLPPLSMECVDALNRFTANSDNTLSSILSTFNTPLTLWASPLIDAATSANDFDIRDVRKKRMTIYFGIPARRLPEAELLVNLFFSQLVNLNLDDLLYSKPELKYQCVMLMDEFAAPGRINIIDKANSFMAGYGMRLLTIIQSPSQIAAEPRKGYGKESAQTLITNHALQILYTPRLQSDANEYSEMLGTYTYKAIGRSRQHGGRSMGGHSESESDQKRALMMPQELKEMSQREQIISLENTKPIKCGKIAYFSDHNFIDRLKEVSPKLAALDDTPYRNWLRKMGFAMKAIPEKKFFEKLWGDGELAVDIPKIDHDLHDAIVQDRKRPMEVSDIENGIDLKKVAIDLSKIDIPDEKECTPEQVENIVDNFFDALETSYGYTDDADVDTKTDGFVDEVNVVENAELDTPDEEILADENNIEAPEMFEISDDTPMIDLSVLDDPLTAKEDL